MEAGLSCVSISNKIIPSHIFSRFVPHVPCGAALPWRRPEAAAGRALEHRAGGGGAVELLALTQQRVARLAERAVLVPGAATVAAVAGLDREMGGTRWDKKIEQDSYITFIGYVRTLMKFLFKVS